MTVADVPARQRYAGNGVTTAFSTVFTFIANSHVRVVYTDIYGDEQELVEHIHYTLTGAGTNAPGVVTTLVTSTTGTVPTGAFLTIMRDVPFTQDFNGEVLSNADAQDLEFSYDKIWMGMQQLKEGLSRAVVSSPGGPGLDPIIKAWTPIPAIEEWDLRPPAPTVCVLRIVDWTGGEGVKPPTGFYVGPAGMVISPDFAVDIRGKAGPPGPGTGNMLTSNNLSDVASKIASFNNLSLYGSDVASVALMNLDTTTGDIVNITGTTAITRITLATGKRRLVRFTGALVLTHSADIILPGGASITTAAGDWALLVGTDLAVACAWYMRANGKAVVVPTNVDMGFGTAANQPVEYFLQTDRSLGDVPDKPAARANLGLGNAAVLNTGTAAGNVVTLSATNTLPALDGSNLINITGTGTGDGQPIPNSSVYAVGTFMLLVLDPSITSLANGSTTSGGFASVPIWMAGGGGFVIQNSSSGVGARPTGTWKNVTGATIGSATANGLVGYFVRTA